MLLALWPLFLVENTSAVNTPEVTVIKETPEFVAVSADVGEVVIKET